MSYPYSPELTILELSSKINTGVPCFVIERSDGKDHPTLVYSHDGACLLPVQTAWLDLAAHGDSAGWRR